MKTMFDAVSLGSLPIKNRLVRSATLEIGGAEDGRITRLLGRIYSDLALGGVGLIITGMMGVSPNSCIHAGMTKIYDESFSGCFREIVEDVHRNNGKIVVQLGHCGAKAGELDEGGHAYAPSDVEMLKISAKAMSVKQIGEVIRAYGAAARKCKDAGADGVQIHAAHGYLISQFLSPLFNKRNDEYGGGMEGRGKLLFEIYDEIRSQVGREYPVLVKVNYSDLAEGGITEDDVLWYCKELDGWGIDAIEVSAGIGIDKASGSVQGGRQDEAFNAEYALRLSQEVSTAVISVGGYRSPETIEKILNSGSIAAVSLCRPLIREPGLPKSWQEGSPGKAGCISCGKCFGSKIHGCYFLP